MATNEDAQLQDPFPDGDQSQETAVQKKLTLANETIEELQETNENLKHKKRLSPSELSPADGFHATSPMYQYARNEFAQTVASGTSNDDGRGILYTSPSETPSRLFDIAI